VYQLTELLKMRPLTKFLFIILTISYQLSAINYSLAQEDIYTAPLFTNEDIYYTPIPAKDFEVEKLNALAKKDAHKMYVIGMMYGDGKNVPESDLTQATEWFKKAASLGHVDAMLELAKIYSLDKEFTGVDKNQIEAQRWINAALKTNSSKALYVAGTMYEDGFPFSKSYDKSAEYYRRAAEKGVLNAYVKMYIAYQYGKGVEPDLKKAIWWLRKIEKEAPDGKIKQYAKDMLGDAYFEIAHNLEDAATKFKIFNLAWSYGNRYAIEAIGDMFQAGVGVKKSYTSAIVAYETAIKNHESVYAMERLGFIYLKGQAEVDADYKKAYELFSKAAVLGGVTAAYELGYMNYYGLGRARNPAEANKWFDRAQQLASKNNNLRLNRVLDSSDSMNKLKNIISGTTEKDAENERQKAIQRQLSNEGIDKEVNQIDDIPKY
jgi:TPR repeat protein